MKGAVKMAPKNKFTKEEMVSAAVQVVRSKGIAGLTAKSMADELGTSTQPIFTCFGTMDSVKEEVYASAKMLYDKYVGVGLKQRIPFFGFGLQYIRFAQDEPELYRLLFLTKADSQKQGAIESMRHSQEIVRPTLMSVYHITESESDRYFRDLWLVVHSISTLIVTGDCPYSDKEIQKIITGFSVSICKAIKEIPGFVSGDFDRDAVFKSII